MRRALKKRDAGKRLALPAALPGVPLVRQIEAADLMLATLHRKPFSDPNWIYELKYDGYRCLVRKAGDTVQLVTRNGNLLNRSFPDIVSAVAALPDDFVLDAELTVDDPGGHPSFSRLKARAATSVASRVRAAIKAHPARLYIFDVMALNGRDLRGLPLVTRKDHLRDCFDNTPTLIYVNGIVGAGEWVFEQVVKERFEGMVAKRLQSPYQRGRTPDWRKIKYAGFGRPAALGFGTAPGAG
ncbi:DNA ligase [Paraburkholderia largidicola]|uniref:ATP-dependent DNA ligase family profile domain-containing protein n=1 Tax=Paraburkholderia largidicola TaxID=3014751 RepID=A0A7I8C2W8_9BURK|nr:DNA ligase [Paraburkholderia sp. PGU16]BCF95382.1 hypothetical protein PPGU16_84490 [Paraburkholderia sp. PGU16]